MNRDGYTPREWRWLLCGLAMMTFNGCGDDDGPGPDTDSGPGSCSTNTDCDDGQFCNGVEICDPDSLAADADGCAASAAPGCLAAQTCDESTRSCLTDCASPDADGDGAAAVNCGGADCDDANPDRYPGNTEVCDLAGVDEDCDPSTLGPDRDGDGFTDALCCNTQSDGSSLCGTDCDDARSGVNPGAVDSCNNLDDDCDSLTDEEPTLEFFRDEDLDGFGRTDMVMLACAQPAGHVVNGGDCDDSNAEIHPGATELCNAIDDNCDSGGGADPAEDMDGDGFGPPGAACMDATDCNDDNDDVFPGQTMFFVEPICPSGERACPCTVGGNTQYGCLPVGDPCMNPASRWCILSAKDYDYNCDEEETRPTGLDCGGPWPGGCLGPTGTNFIQPVATFACGNNVTWGSCTNDAFLMTCDFSRGDTRPMGCR